MGGSLENLAWEIHVQENPGFAAFLKAHQNKHSNSKNRNENTQENKNPETEYENSNSPHSHGYGLRMPLEYQKTCTSIARLLESFGDLSTDYFRLKMKKFVIMEKLTDYMDSVHYPSPSGKIPATRATSSAVEAPINKLDLVPVPEQELLLEQKKARVLKESEEYVQEFTQKILPRLKVFQIGCRHQIQSLESLVNMDAKGIVDSQLIPPVKLSYLRRSAYPSLISLLGDADRMAEGCEEVISFVHNFISAMDRDDSSSEIDKKGIQGDNIMELKEKSQKRKSSLFKCCLF